MDLAHAGGPSTRKRLLVALRVVVSVGLLTLLFSRIDAGELWANAKGASLPWLVFALALEQYVIGRRAGTGPHLLIGCWEPYPLAVRRVTTFKSRNSATSALARISDHSLFLCSPAGPSESVNPPISTAAAGWFARTVATVWICRLAASVRSRASLLNRTSSSTTHSLGNCPPRSASSSFSRCSNGPAGPADDRIRSLSDSRSSLFSWRRSGMTSARGTCRRLMSALSPATRLIRTSHPRPLDTARKIISPLSTQSTRLSFWGPPLKASAIQKFFAHDSCCSRRATRASNVGMIRVNSIETRVSSGRSATLSTKASSFLSSRPVTGTITVSHAASSQSTSSPSFCQRDLPSTLRTRTRVGVAAFLGVF